MSSKEFIKSQNNSGELKWLGCIQIQMTSREFKKLPENSKGFKGIQNN